MKEIREFVRTVIRYLISRGILPENCEYERITIGAGGAILYTVTTPDGHYILKLATDAFSIEPHMQGEYEKEYQFYRLNESLRLPFVPGIRFLEKNSRFGTIILMVQYQPIAHNEWMPELLMKAAETIADLHAIPAETFAALGLQRQDMVIDLAAMAESHAMWRKVAARFPGQFDPAELDEIHENIGMVCDWINRGPFCVGHGDYHPENLLLDGDSIRICDWQNVSLGGRAGDLSFFFSRGCGFGIAIDEVCFLDAYCARMGTYGIIIQKADILKERYASYLYTTFAYWAEYLQNSPYEQVKQIYDAMVDAYRYLRND